MGKEPHKYNYQRKNKANIRAALRAAVALYIIYLGWQIIAGSSADSGSSMPEWVAFLIGGGFILAAVLFGLYTWRRYRTDMKGAELTPEELAEEDSDFS